MKERIAKWDNVKWLMIVLVVVGHFIDYHEDNSRLFQAMFLFIYSFHIPAFLFVSGLMAKRAVNEVPFRAVRIISFWVLYLVCNGLTVAVKALAGKSPSIHLFGQDHYSWFLFVLPVYYLLTRAIKRLPPWYTLAFFVLLGCLAGYDSRIGDGLFLSRILVFYPFFLAGYYLRGEQVLAWLKPVTVRISAGVLLCGLFLACYGLPILYLARPLLTGRNGFAQCGFWCLPFGGVYRLLYYAAAFLLIGAVIAVAPTRKVFFTPWGARTLQVYVLHRPILFLLQDFGVIQSLKEGLPVWWCLLYLVGALGLTVLLSLKYWEKPFAYLLNPPGERSV